MSRPETGIQVDDGGFPGVPSSLLAAAVRRTLAAEEERAEEVSVALLADEEMRRLNQEFLGKDATTDVLAFALSEGDEPVVGDIYVGYEQAVRQAGELGVPVGEELARLVIHGTLHVLGHDHPEGSERTSSTMFRLQERLLSELLTDAANG